MFFSVHRGRPQALHPLQICSRLLQAIGEHVFQFELGQNLSFNRIDHYNHLRNRIVRELPNLLLIDANRIGGGLVCSLFNDRRWPSRSGRKR